MIPCTPSGVSRGSRLHAFTAPTERALSKGSTAMASIPFIAGSAYGDRTRISALRGPCPNRLDERANLVNQNGIIIGESSVSSTGFVRLQAKNSSFFAALITYERHNDDLIARKVLYKGSESSSMLLVMRRRHISWLLALLALAGSLVLTSCMNQEGIAPGSGELKDRPGSTGY
jgi:hypothetical protein